MLRLNFRVSIQLCMLTRIPKTLSIRVLSCNQTLIFESILHSLPPLVAIAMSPKCKKCLKKRQQDEQTIFSSKLQHEKEEFDQRQKSELGRMLKKQEEEEQSLQRSRSRQSETTSPKSFISRPNSRRPSLKTHIELPSCETLSDSSGPSLWEWTVPDEGYCTGKDGELPEMIDSARKELECPIR